MERSEKQWVANSVLFSRLVREMTSQNELIFTCDWDDPPHLFFENEKNRYFVFLDPNFMARWKPALWERWRSLVAGKFGTDSYSVLRYDFGVRYGVCTNDYKDLRSIISEDENISIIYQDGAVFVFRLAM